MATAAPTSPSLRHVADERRRRRRSAAEVTSSNGCLVLIAFVPTADYRCRVASWIVKGSSTWKNGILSSGAQRESAHRRAANPMRLPGKLRSHDPAILVYVCQVRNNLQNWHSEDRRTCRIVAEAEANATNACVVRKPEAVCSRERASSLAKFQFML